VISEALEQLPGSLREPGRRIASEQSNRLRSDVLLAVAGRAWPGTARRTAEAAAAVELLHLATLVHDDLIADLPVRRGTPTINAKDGPAVAVLVGDALIGLAHRLAVNAGIGDLLAAALLDISAGQALHSDSRFHPDVTAATALRVAELRTGSLLATAAVAGAVVTGMPTDGLHDYGLAFGTAVHLLDDVLALHGDDTDAFAAGIITLPAVHVLATSPELRRLLRPGLDTRRRKRANALLRSGVPATLATAGTLIAQAGQCRPELADLPARYLQRQLALIS
jgi:octaprenyl-diphosphate synthase